MTSFKSSVPVRQFFVYSEPHLADPAWLIPVVEHRHKVSENGNECIDIIRYNNFDELEKVVAEGKLNLLRQQVRLEVQREILEILGLTPDDYIKKVREFHTKQNEEN